VTGGARSTTLAATFSGRKNAVNFLRLLLASSVMVSHAWPLGLGRPNLGLAESRGQTDVGTMAVYGFFVISGFLVTRSARRTPFPRYVWHRVLRIFPGYWVCILLTGLVLAPVLAWRHGADVSNVLQGRSGGIHYVGTNFWTATRQYGIDHLLLNTPYGRNHHSSIFNGSLWSLRYELLCYLAAALLAVFALTRRTRWLAPIALVLLYAYLVRDAVHAGFATGQPFSHPYFDLPLLGPSDLHFLIYLGFLFVLGGCFELFADRVPISPVLGAAAAVALLVTLRFGLFFLVGLPAYAYLLLWLAVRLPARLHGVGRKRDLSYGIYIYGFVTQQVLASTRLMHRNHGFPLWLATSIVVTYGLAFLSWHLVERPALRLKDWRPRLPRRRAGEPPADEPERADDSVGVRG
jgi:peptidoglycan/LPS O-acetylase OafA/YrhL